MHRLFSLILLLGSVQTAAAPGLVIVSFAHQDQIHLNEIDTKYDTQTLSLVSPTLFEHLTLNLQNTYEQTQISTRNLTGPTGTQTPLKAIDDGTRQILTVGAEYSYADFFTALSSSQDIKSSVFAAKSYSALLQWSPYSGASRLFAKVEESTQSQPLSYFTDPESLQSKPRLQKILTQRYSLGFEQILTENWRTQLTVTELHLRDLRPVQQKIVTANSYALSSRTTIRMDLGASAEKRSESLKDDRGYFEARWLDLQLSHEWALNSIIGLGWSTVYETEVDPRRSFDAQVGTDSVGFFVDKNFSIFSVVAKIAAIKTSQGDSGVSGSADLKWEF